MGRQSITLRAMTIGFYSISFLSLKNVTRNYPRKRISSRFLMISKKQGFEQSRGIAGLAVKYAMFSKKERNIFLTTRRTLVKYNGC